MADTIEDMQLQLDDIVARKIPGVTRTQASQHVEACLICLDHHAHQTGVELMIEEVNTKRYQVRLHWQGSVDDQMRRAWKDMQEATEYGAVALAILLVLEMTEYTVIERSVKGTGFDYWLLERETYEQSDQIFPKGTTRLEVSGIIQASKDSDIRARVQTKLKQTIVSDAWSIPAIVIVVEFSRPEAQIARKS